MLSLTIVSKSQNARSYVFFKDEEQGKCVTFFFSHRHWMQHTFLKLEYILKRATVTSSGLLEELFLPPPHTRLPTRYGKPLPDSSFFPSSRIFRSDILLTEVESAMGEVTLPRRMFLWCVAVIYMVAFVSLYVQVPGEDNATARAAG